MANPFDVQPRAASSTPAQKPVTKTAIVPAGAMTVTLPNGNTAYKTPSGGQIEVLPNGNRVATLPAHLGAGSYNINTASPGKVINTGHTTYGGIPAQAGKNRDDIVPVSLGGANTNPMNIRVVPAKDNPAKLETQLANDVKTGRTTLGQAREKILTTKNQPKTSLFNKIADVADNISLGANKVAGNVYKNAVQPILRSGASIGSTIVSPLLNKGNIPNEVDLSNTAAGRALFGNEPIKTIPGAYDEGRAALKSGGFGPKSSAVIAAAASLAPTLDLAGMDENSAAKLIAKSKDAGVIANVLRKLNVAEDIIPDAAAKFANLSKEADVKAGLESIARTQKETSLATKAARSEALSQRELPGQIPTSEIARAKSIPAPVENVDSSMSYSGSVAEAQKTASEVIHNPPSVRGGLASPPADLINWKDKPALGLGRETLERNLDRVAGKDAPAMKQFITDPIRQNETLRTEFTNNLRNEVKKDVIQGKQIRPGSKEDALVQQFGEGRISLSDLKNKTTKPEQVVEAASYFRNKYDQLLDMVNAERTKFGYDPIPKRADYFRHFQEVGNVIDQMGVLFRENDLPTEISGMTNIFKPGKPFSTAELARKGGPFTDSAIGGMDNYIDSITKQIFHIDSVQRVRALEKYIREAGEAGQAKLPNFVANLREYGNQLSGKKALIDRSMEDAFGRGAFGVMNALKRRIGSNMVVGNVSSALTNFIPFTQSLATTSKPAALRGIFEGLTAPLAKDSLSIGGVKSGFLTRRFPTGNLVTTTIQKGAAAAGSLFKGIDFFAARSIVAGKYYEYVAQGKPAEAAMKLADEYAGRVLADRSIGQMPNLFGSKALGPITQFQLEVNNMVSFAMRDIPHLAQGQKLKVASGLAQFALYSYLYNQAFEKITGRRPTIDPIQAALQISGISSDTQGMDPTTRLRKASKEFIGNLPGGNLLVEGGRFPLASSIPNVSDIMQGKNLGKEAEKFGTTFVTPFGGAQAKKTFEGIKAYREGGVKDAKGKFKFKIPPGPGSALRSGVFGPSSSPAAQQYYNKLIYKPKATPKIKVAPSKASGGNPFNR